VANAAALPSADEEQVCQSVSLRCVDIAAQQSNKAIAADVTTA